MTRNGIFLLIGVVIFLGGFEREIATVQGNGDAGNIPKYEYVGCFATDGCLFSWSKTYTLSNNTLGICYDQCKNVGFPYFGLYNGGTCSCSCSCQNPCGHFLSNRTDGQSYPCGVPCSGDLQMLCGGINATSISKDISANCATPENGSDDGPKALLIAISSSLIGLVIVFGAVPLCFCVLKSASDIRRSSGIRYDSSSYSLRNESSDYRGDPQSIHSCMVSDAGNHHRHANVNDTSDTVNAACSPGINRKESTSSDDMEELSAHVYCTVIEAEYTQASTPAKNQAVLNALPHGRSTSARVKP